MPTPNVHNGHVGAIAGGVVATIAMLAVILFAGRWLMRRKRTVDKPDLESPKNSTAEREAPFPPTIFSPLMIENEDENSRVTPAFFHSYTTETSAAYSKAGMRAIGNLPPEASAPNHITPEFRPHPSIDATYSYSGPSVISDQRTSNPNPHLSNASNPDSSTFDASGNNGA
jgi:hypothetical protein